MNKSSEDTPAKRKARKRRERIDQERADRVIKDEKEKKRKTYIDKVGRGKFDINKIPKKLNKQRNKKGQILKGNMLGRYVGRMRAYKFDEKKFLETFQEYVDHSWKRLEADLSCQEQYPK